MRGERPQPSNRFPRAVAERAGRIQGEAQHPTLGDVGLEAEAVGNRRRNKIAAGATTGSFAASNVTSPPPRSINRI